jgi:hypothetical protein
MPSARISLCRSLLLLVLASPRLSLAGQDVDKKILKIFEQQMFIDAAQPDEKNPAGLRIQLVKIDDAPTAQGTQVRYRVRIPGAPEGLKYQLVMMSIHGGTQVVRDAAYVNARGLLMEAKPKPSQENSEELNEEDEVEVAFISARGEPVRFSLISADRKHMFPGTIVPHTIESADGDCRIEARLGLPHAEGVLVYADGLPPNTAVPYQSDSETESHPGKFTVDDKGHARAILLPAVKGLNAGVLKVTISTNDCNVSVEIPWGKGSYQLR